MMKTISSFSDKIEMRYNSKNTQNGSSSILVTNNYIEAVLYLKSTGGYPLLPYINTISEAFISAKISSLKNVIFYKLGKFVFFPLRHPFLL